MLPAQLLCVGLLVAAASAEDFTWVGVTSDSSRPQPPARHSAAMGAMAGSYYVFGGKGNEVNGTSVLGKGRAGSQLEEEGEGEGTPVLYQCVYNQGSL